MAVLDQIGSWDVPDAAAAIFDVGGPGDTHGDIRRSFELASVTKPIAAFAALVAVEEGVVSLDDSVRGAPPAASVRHLLAHASGVSPDDPDRVLAEPGTRRIYSNAGFELLADHVATASEMPFADYVAAALVQPLDLSATDVSGSPAHGHRSSVADLMTLWRAVLDGTLLASSTLQTLTTPAFADVPGVLPGFGAHEPNPWGLGVEIRGHKDPHWTAAGNSPSTWGHFGRAGTFVWWDPAAEIGLIVLTDREFGDWARTAWPALSRDVLAASG